MRGGTLVTAAALDDLTRLWSLTLVCGHTVTRRATYRSNRPFGGPTRRRPRALSDVVPHQKRAYCDQCPTGPAVHDTAVIRIRASPERATGWAALLAQIEPAIERKSPAWRAGGFVDIECTTTAAPPDGPSEQARRLLDAAIRIGLPVAGGQVRELLEQLAARLTQLDTERNQK